MGQKRDRVEESDDEMSAVSDEFAPTPSKCVKISNCEDSFNDGVLHKLFGAALASRIAHEGVTWAVSREGLKFAGFGWVRFATVEHARRATEFDVMGPRAKEGREHNEGNDLFIAFHHDEVCVKKNKDFTLFHG